MKVPFSSLVQLTRGRGSVVANQSLWETELEAKPYADLPGVHVYSDLRLKIPQAAGDLLGNAALLLRALQDYASTLETCASPLSMEILEVQGPRVHLFWPHLSPGPIEFESLKLFGSSAFYLIREQLTRVAPQLHFTLRMAADYGRTVLLRSSGKDQSSSLVSLGIAANRPAKKLARPVGNAGVNPGEMVINAAAFFSPGYDERTDVRWESVLIDSLDLAKLRTKPDFQLSMARLASVVEANERVRASVIQPNPGNPTSEPKVVSGFMFRADMDGFSPRVKAAMEQSDEAVQQLVDDFNGTMERAMDFATQLPEGVHVLPFPWAGDCSNLFLRCDDYRLERHHLPNIAALRWFDEVGGKKDARREADRPGWVISIAGGDPDDGDHGRIMTANVAAAGRLFHVGAGWSWRTSLEAEQSDGLRAQDTVLQVEDHLALERSYQQAYREHASHPSLYRIASEEALRIAQRSRDRGLSGGKQVEVTEKGIALPLPRPYHEDF